MNILTVSIVACFPVVFMYSRNALEVSLLELAQAIGIFSLMGLVAYILSTLLLRSHVKGGLISVICVLFIMNFTILEKGIKAVFTSLKYWHISFLFIVILAHVVWGVCRYLSNDTIKTLQTIMLVVCGGLIILNVVMALPNIINRVKFDLTNAEKTATTMGDESLPNFYYLIMDEYGGPKAMQDYYNYDFTGEQAFFEELGFSFSTDSFAATPQTWNETTNLFNLDYVTDNVAAEKYEDLRVNGSFFTELTQRGYNLHGVGVLAAARYLLPSVFETAQSEATTFEGKGFKRILFENTVFYPFLSQSYAYTQRRDEAIRSFEFLSTPKNFPKGGQFYLFHSTVPHMPFIFAEDGSVLDLSLSSDAANKEVYLGQYKYCSKWLQKIAASIVKNDPDSIIVIQSDHGFRGGLSAISAELTNLHKLNIFNAVYYRGKEINIHGMSSINTLRTICNQLYGANYILLEDRGKKEVNIDE